MRDNFPLETVEVIFIDREAGKIIRLVASVRPLPFSRRNRLTYDLDFWHGGQGQPLSLGD